MDEEDKTMITYCVCYPGADCRICKPHLWECVSGVWKKKPQPKIIKNDDPDKKSVES